MRQQDNTTNILIMFAMCCIALIGAAFGILTHRFTGLSVSYSSLVSVGVFLFGEITFACCYAFAAPGPRIRIIAPPAPVRPEHMSPLPTPGRPRPKQSASANPAYDDTGKNASQCSSYSSVRESLKSSSESTPPQPAPATHSSSKPTTTSIQTSSQKIADSFFINIDDQDQAKSSLEADLRAALSSLLHGEELEEELKRILGDQYAGSLNKANP